MPELKIIIVLFLFNVLEIFGFFYATREEDDDQGQQVLWWVKAASKKVLGEWWTKPVCGCSICMSSVHSFLFWIPIYILFPFSFMLIYAHALYILSLAGFNYVLTSWKGLEL